MVFNKTKTKNFTKKVQEIVRDELEEELEDKHALIGGDTRIINSPSIPAGNVSANPNFIRLLPEIIQGGASAAGQYNQRVGNEIRLKHLDIGLLLAWNRQFDIDTNPQLFKDDSLGVRVMIVRQKDSSDVPGALENFQGDKLLENGNILIPGPSDFNGRTINLFQKINREQFAVRYDKTFYMDRPKQINTTVVSNTQFVKPPRPAYFKHRLTFGKRGLKLTFGNSLSTAPTNFPYFMIIGYVSCTDINAPSNQLLNYSYSSNAIYTDA